MGYLALGVGLLAGLLLAAQWYTTASLAQVRRAFRALTIVAVLAAGLYLVVTGKLFLALMTLPALWPLIRGMRSAATRAKNFARMAEAEAGSAGGTPGETSEVETRFLRLSLDHGTGEISGDVLRGAFEGRTIQSLALGEILDLAAECQEADPPSVQILEAYLERNHPGWRDEAEGRGRSGGGGGSGGGARGDAGGPMTRDEALAVLGLKDSATEAEIKAAYHRIISGLHPDKGGSDYLASKVNEAKSVLLDG